MLSLLVLNSTRRASKGIRWNFVYPELLHFYLLPGAYLIILVPVKTFKHVFTVLLESGWEQIQNYSCLLKCCLLKVVAAVFSFSFLTSQTYQYPNNARMHHKSPDEKQPAETPLVTWTTFAFLILYFGSMFSLSSSYENTLLNTAVLN